MTLKEMQEKRAQLFAQLKEVNNKDSLTAEDRQNWDRINNEINALKDQITRAERVQALEQEMATPPASDVGRDNADGRSQAEGENRPATPADRRNADAYRSMFRQYVAGGWNNLGANESRALQADLDVSGGYLVPPTEWVSSLIKAVDNAVVIRQLATVQQLTMARSLGAPTMDTDVDDAAWTGEITSAGESTGPTFGKRELNPHPLAKLVKVSATLINKGVQNPETIVRDRLAYKFGVVQEAAFMTGSGSGQPLGLFTSSADGVSTSCDVSTGNTTTEIKLDGLISARGALKQQYRRNARWIFHRDAITMLRKVKDGNGQYLWSPGLGGDADSIFGIPIIESEYAPNTFTTGLRVGLLGDLSYYWIAEAMSLNVQRLVELYARTNQVGFIGRAEIDAMPILAEAFVAVKLA